MSSHDGEALAETPRGPRILVPNVRTFRRIVREEMCAAMAVLREAEAWYGCWTESGRRLPGDHPEDKILHRALRRWLAK